MLSRITLGADVVVTSTILSAALERFPPRRYRFVGPRKNWALFAGNPRVEPLAFDYPRGGTLAERITAWQRPARSARPPGAIVIDPDSRLSQLGLLPVRRRGALFLLREPRLRWRLGRAARGADARAGAPRRSASRTRSRSLRPRPPARATTSRSASGWARTRRSGWPIRSSGACSSRSATGASSWIKARAGPRRSASSARSPGCSHVEHVAGGLRALRRHDRAQPTLCRLRLGGAARGGGRGSAAGVGVCGLCVRAHVPALASDAGGVRWRWSRCSRGMMRRACSRRR